MWSATWPKEVEKLSNEVFQNPPVRIRIGNNDNLTVNTDVKQNVYCMAEDEKYEK